MGVCVEGSKYACLEVISAGCSRSEQDYPMCQLYMILSSGNPPGRAPERRHPQWTPFRGATGRGRQKMERTPPALSPPCPASTRPHPPSSPLRPPSPPPRSSLSLPRPPSSPTRPPWAPPRYPLYARRDSARCRRHPFSRRYNPARRRVATPPHAGRLSHRHDAPRRCHRTP